MIHKAKDADSARFRKMGQEEIEMEMKKVWTSQETGEKSRYGYRAVGGTLGIVLLMTVLLLGGTFLSLSMGLPQEWSSMLLVVLVSGLGIALAVRLGRRGLQDATIFFLTEGDRLWVMDVRDLSKYGRGFWGFAAGTMKTQSFLRAQGKKPFLTNRAEEIRKVLNIKENRSHYAIRCQSCYPDRPAVRRTYFLVKGIPDEEMLLQELERRKTWENVLEPADNRKPLYILLSGLSLAACVSLCVLSHPAVAKLPGEIYFPCMGASLIAFYFLLYFMIRQRRGE